MWRRRIRPSREDLRFGAWTLLVALVIAVGTAGEHWQALLTFCFVLIAAGLYVRWPTAGTAMLLVLWTLAPLFRRLLDYAAYSSGPDVLSLAPYLATAAIGAIALVRERPRGAPLIVIGLVWMGLVIGIPLGASNPLPLLYGLFAYGAGSLAILIGYADWRRGRLTLERILLVLLPFIAAYGLYQYFAPTLPPWDQLWLQANNFVTAGSKEQGNFRFFSVLNAPGTLAGLLTLLVTILLVAPRLTVTRLVALSLALVCVVLIGIRGAWVALAVALLAITLVARGHLLGRLLVVCAVAGGLAVAAGGTPAGNQLSQQVQSFGNLSQDTSYRARLDAVKQYGPQAVAAPLGHGVGSVGQAARVSSNPVQPPPFEDNGYLIILWQVGALGFLLIVGAAVWAVVRGARRTARAHLPERLQLLAPLIASGVFMASGDALYGVTAVIFWYFLGALLAASEPRPGAEGPEAP